MAPRRSTAALALSAFVCVAGCRRPPPAPAPPAVRVSRLDAHRRAARAGGRLEDLVLRDAVGARLVFATGPDAEGHRPLRGALVDALPSAEDDADPLLWWRPAWLDAQGAAHPLVADTVEEARCEGGSPGVRASGAVDGVRLELLACVSAQGGFALRTRALGPLPAGASLGEQVRPGPAPVAVAGWGQAWELRTQSAWYGWTLGRHAVLVEGTEAELSRAAPVRGEGPTELLVRRTADAQGAVLATLRVARGEWLGLVGQRADANRHVRVRWEEHRGGVLTLAGGSGNGRATVGTVRVPEGEELELRLPGSFFSSRRGPEGWDLELRARDERGVPATAAVTLTGATEAPQQVRLRSAPSGTLRLRFTDAERRPLAVRAVLRGVGEARDPQPTVGGRAVSAGRALYLLDGRAEVSLAPGRYHVAATHGPAWSLAEAEVEVRAGASEELTRSLRQVVDTTGWVAADLRVYTDVAGDGVVSPMERALSLLCEGVDVAVSVGRGRLAPLAAALTALGQQGALSAATGLELDSGGASPAGSLVGWALTPDERAPEAQASAYWNVTPARLFEGLRAAGAQSLVVPRPRAEGGRGYLAALGFDASTGQAREGFVEQFEGLEVWDGDALDAPERALAGLRDLAGLARRGLRIAAVGSSGSQRLEGAEAGWPRTWLRASLEPEGTRLRRAGEALARGESSVSAGPFVELRAGEQGAGSVVRAGPEGLLRLHVRVQAPAWIPVQRVQLVVDGEPAQAREVPALAAGSEGGVRFEGDFEVRVARDAVVHAWADATASVPEVLANPRARAVGFSGALYVDADGDGRVR